VTGTDDRPPTVDQLTVGSARPVLIDTAMGSVAALRCGADDAPPALLVPGYTGSKEDFGPILQTIADAGFGVTAIDLPGQFESAGPQAPGDYTPDRLAAAVLDVAAALGPGVHLVGHSFGGLVTRAAAISRPSAFASLVLMSSGPAAIAGRRREHMELLAPVFESGGLEAVYAASQAVDAADPDYLPPRPELAEFLRRRFLAGAPAMLLGMGDALRAEPDRVAELAATRLPVLVLCGADDDAWPPAVQHDMAQRLGAQQVTISGAAHSPAIENPTATAAALVSFWRAHR
jgi:pimeloyl-ACP methyl ester carboxylesterase